VSEPVIRTPLTELLRIRHPVVQAAMGYVSGPRLAAATSNAGGLALIASATMSLDELRDAVRSALTAALAASRPLKIVHGRQALGALRRGFRVPGLGGHLIAGSRAGRVLVVQEQVPQVDHRPRGHVGVPGIDS